MCFLATCTVEATVHVNFFHRILTCSRSFLALTSQTCHCQWKDSPNKGLADCYDVQWKMYNVVFFFGFGSLLFYLANHVFLLVSLTRCMWQSNPWRMQISKEYWEAFFRKHRLCKNFVTITLLNCLEFHFQDPLRMNHWGWYVQCNIVFCDICPFKVFKLADGHN